MKTLVKFLLLLILIVTPIACVAQAYQPSQPQPAAPAQQVQVIEPAQVQALPTETPVPTATMDYLSTAMVAQQMANDAQVTADAALRINAQVTSEHEARELEAARLIHDETMMAGQVQIAAINATASIAPTLYAMTGTQQVILNTQIPYELSIYAGQMTGTKEAPTMIAAIEYARWSEGTGARIQRFLGMALQFAAIVFLIGLVAFLLRYPIQPAKTEDVEEKPEPTETIIHRVEKRNGGYNRERLVVPCTPEQLTEFAQAITQGERTMAINEWEGGDTKWTRDTYLPFRAWTRDMEFSVDAGNNQLAPTNDFLDFLMGWLDTRALRTGHEFQPAAEPVGDGVEEAEAVHV